MIELQHLNHKSNTIISEKSKRLPELAGLLITPLAILSFCWRQKSLENYTRRKKPVNPELANNLNCKSHLGEKLKRKKFASYAVL